MAPPGGVDLGRILGEGRRWWGERPPAFRRNLVLGGGASLAAAIALSLLLTRNPMTVVFANLSPQDAGQITQTLQSDKIPYELQGTTILVPRSMADQVRVNLAMQGLPHQGTVGYDNVLQNMSLGMTSQAFNLAVLNALQADLATTIDGVQGVKASTVQIVMPQPSVFVSQPSQSASAAVFVDLAPGASLTPKQVLGIEELVAHSVPGLTLANISVTDQNGDLLTAANPNGGDPSGTVDGQMGLTQAFEKNLDKQLTALLTPIAGSGNVVVQTHASLDFSQTKTTSTVFQPLPSGQGIPVSSHIIKESFSGSGAPPSVAGSGSNAVPTYPVQGTGGTSTMSYTDASVSYAVSKVNRTVTSQPYTVTALTVSVMLNQNAYRLTSTNRAALTKLIATAIGYPNKGSASQDITIFASPFSKPKVPAFPTPASSLPPLPLLGAAALGVLLLLFVLVRLIRRKPEPVWTPLQPEPSVVLPEPREDPLRPHLERVEETIRNRPEDMAQVVRAWLRDDAKDKVRPRT